MIIEWLNNEMTSARITRREWPRFWHKVTATVYLDMERYHNCWYYEGHLDEHGSPRLVEGSFEGSFYAHRGLARRLDLEKRFESEWRASTVRKHKRRALTSPWKPVADVPRARALS